MGFPKDLVAASATPLILSILQHGESYGYDIIGQVRTLSGGKMQWPDGMLYPILHRLVWSHTWILPATPRELLYPVTALMLRTGLRV